MPYRRTPANANPTQANPTRIWHDDIGADDVGRVVVFKWCATDADFKGGIRLGQGNARALRVAFFPGPFRGGGPE